MVRSKENSKRKSVANVKRDELTGNSITKSNALARAYYRFNLVEKRVMESMISKLNPLSDDVSQLQEIELRAQDYCDAFNVPLNNAYKDLQDAVQGLMRKVFTVRIPRGFKDFNLMSHASYLESEGRIVCSFNSYVTPHLLGLKDKFSKYPLEDCSDFKSSYTWRMYEILVSWAQDPKKNEGRLIGWFSISVDELQRILGCDYKWAMFERCVLKISKKELWDKSKIRMEYEKIKTVRKVTKLNFQFAEMDDELDSLESTPQSC